MSFCNFYIDVKQSVLVLFQDLYVPKWNYVSLKWNNLEPNGLHLN